MEANGAAWWNALSERVAKSHSAGGAQNERLRRFRFTIVLGEPDPPRRRRPAASVEHDFQARWQKL